MINKNFIWLIFIFFLKSLNSKLSSLNSSYLEPPHNGRNNGEQTHLVGFGVDGEIHSFGIHIGVRLQENEEGVFAIIDVINGKVQSGFKAFGLFDGPVHGNVETVVGRHPISVALAEFGDVRAHVEVVPDRDGHRVAGLIDPQG